MRITIQSFWPAIVWLMLATAAFCIPGSALPQDDWFAKIQLDKWIHVGIFSVMIFLWCLPLLHKQTLPISLPKLFIVISVVFFGYGILMEFIQHFFIVNRSFDWGDIAADAVGCLLGFIFTKTQWKP